MPPATRGPDRCGPPNPDRIATASDPRGRVATATARGGRALDGKRDKQPSAGRPRRHKPLGGAYVYNVAARREVCHLSTPYEAGARATNLAKRPAPPTRANDRTPRSHLSQRASGAPEPAGKSSRDPHRRDPPRRTRPPPSPASRPPGNSRPQTSRLDATHLPRCRTHPATRGDAQTNCAHLAIATLIDRRNGRTHGSLASHPPSTITSVPVMKLACSDSRYRQACATSSAVPSRRNGVRCIIRTRRSGFPS